MARGPCTFKQQDLTRALRAAVAAGCPAQRVEIDRNGKMILVMIERPEVQSENPGRPNEIVL
jgi:hypothetical protein